MSEEVPACLVISAPSGAGKTTLAEGLLGCVDRLTRVITCTTRPPRPGEREGQDYFFVQPEEFDRRCAAAEFVEWAQVHGNRYGTPASEIERIHAMGHDAVLVIDVQGADAVRTARSDAVTVFVLPPSRQALAGRLSARDAKDEVARDAIDQRLSAARREIAQYVGYDYVVVNDDLETAVAELAAIVRAERCRGVRRAAVAERILTSFDDDDEEPAPARINASEGK